jgi:hypothetical protein
MAKFAGLVGYVTQEETSPGVWSPVENPTMMKGDVISQRSNVIDDSRVNSNITLNHRVSLLGDSYAFDNYYSIRWIDFRGKKLEVSSVEIQRPRIIVSLGGLWNG